MTNRGGRTPGPSSGLAPPSSPGPDPRRALDDGHWQPPPSWRSYAFDRTSAIAAVLDGAGTIVATNDAWRSFAAHNGGADGVRPGSNYLDVCDRTQGVGHEDAAAVAAGLRQILEGDRPRFDREYPCSSPTEERWFLLEASATPVHGAVGVVVCHVDVTVRRQLKEQLAAAAPESPAGTLLVATPDGVGIDGVGIDAAGADLRTALHASQAMAEAIVAHSHELVMFFRGDGTIVWVSPACRELLGVEPDDLVGLNGLEIIHPDDQERVFGEFTTIPNLGDHVRTEFRVLDLGGQVRWVEETATNLVDEPRVGVIVGNLREITDRKEAEEAVRFQARLLAAAGQAIIAEDMDGKVIYWNDAAQKTYGWTAAEAMGRDLASVLPAAEGWAPQAQEINAQLSDGHAWSGEFWVQTKDRTLLPVMVANTPVLDDDGVQVATIGVATDITERHAAEMALAHQATHDALTGLPNRVSLTSSLQAHLAGPSVPGTGVAVAFLDLDQFKVINDTLGHALGDRLLETVADRLRSGLRATDLVARFGGDEFVLVRPGVPSFDAARALGEDAARALHDPLPVGDQLFHLTASIGVTLSHAADTPDTLLSDADAAMYQAKDDGRGRTTVFDGAARARAHRRLTLESSLQHVLDRGELHLAYQPVLDLETLEVAGFEALLRWTHPTLGPIGPDEFISLAERTGAILPIGDWVIGRGLEQLAAWRADPGIRADLWLAINLSPHQLARDGLVERIGGALAAAAIPPDRVHLEITETVLMDRVDEATATIAALRAQGVRVSIDDFGTGYSSLAYLNRLPIDILKIDRSFLEGVGRDGHDTAIVRAIAGLAHTLGLDVVAEGIEHPDQLGLVQELGCAFGQGFLWSPALAPDAATAWMLAAQGAPLR